MDKFDELIMCATNDGALYESWFRAVRKVLVLGHPITRLNRPMNDIINTYTDEYNAYTTSSGYVVGRLIAELICQYGTAMRDKHPALKFTTQRNTSHAICEAVTIYNAAVDAYSSNNPISKPIVEETNMSNTTNNVIKDLENTAVTTVHAVFGQVITADTPDSFFIDLIRTLKRDIDALDDLLDSTKMQDKQVALIKKRAAIVKLFDSRV